MWGWAVTNASTPQTPGDGAVTNANTPKSRESLGRRAQRPPRGPSDPRGREAGPSLRRRLAAQGGCWRGGASLIGRARPLHQRLHPPGGETDNKWTRRLGAPPPRPGAGEAPRARGRWGAVPTGRPAAVASAA